MKTKYRLRQVVWWRDGLQWSKSQGSIVAVVWGTKGMFYEIELSNGVLLRLPEKAVQAVKREECFKVVKS